MTLFKTLEEYLQYIQGLSLSQLEDIALHLDKKKQPERHQAVLDLISKRRSESSEENAQVKNVSTTSEKMVRHERDGVNSQEIEYAGFWLRLGAHLVDSLVFLIPFVFIFLPPVFFYFYYYLGSMPWGIGVIIRIPSSLFWPFYNIYFLGRWGQTLGKKAVKIKVVSLNGSPIGYSHAFMRHFVDLFFVVLLVISEIIALISISQLHPAIPDSRDVGRLLHAATPLWGLWAGYGQIIWVFSELIVLLFNERKRAIHDFIAGTVVIKTKR